MYVVLCQHKQNEVMSTSSLLPMITQDMVFTDDYSRYGYVDLMRWKSETFEKFKEFRAEVENQSGKRKRAIQSNQVMNTFLGISRIT